MAAGAYEPASERELEMEAYVERGEEDYIDDPEEQIQDTEVAAALDVSADGPATGLLTSA